MPAAVQEMGSKFGDVSCGERRSRYHIEQIGIPFEAYILVSDRQEAVSVQY